MAQEFGTVNNASAKSREERETTLRKQYEAVFYDPADIVKKAKLAKERIENYLEEIDAILGNATEMTTITVSYWVKMIYLWYIATFVISKVRHQTIQVIYVIKLFKLYIMCFLTNEICRVIEKH